MLPKVALVLLMGGTVEANQEHVMVCVVPGFPANMLWKRW